jgi:hypothetical protein
MTNDPVQLRRGRTSVVRVGVTDFAQEPLGDVVDVTLPGLGETIRAGVACGDIESVKRVSKMIAPHRDGPHPQRAAYQHALARQHPSMSTSNRHTSGPSPGRFRIPVYTVRPCQARPSRAGQR